MLPCCWITALVALLAGFGVSFFNPSKEFIIFEVILAVVVGFFILKKVRNKKNKCCSKKTD